MSEQPKKTLKLIERMIKFSEIEAASGDFLNAISILDRYAKELKDNVP